MTPFTTLTARAVPLLEANIDTDIIVPARFLLQTGKKGLGATAFFERRYDAAGAPRPEFPFNQPRFRDTQILLAGANFGCGSSREHAVWALADLGLRCIVAPGFGEIFESNCIKNGILPIRLDAAAVLLLATEAERGRPVSIDLVACTVTAGDDATFAFEIAAEPRTALLNGWDEVAFIAASYAGEIRDFEDQQQRLAPWLWRSHDG
jgi:3-isopropylmalate dehydratase small subunit